MYAIFCWKYEDWTVLKITLNSAMDVNVNIVKYSNSEKNCVLSC